MSIASCKMLKFVVYW